MSTMDYAHGGAALPVAIHKALTATDVGATGVAWLAIEGLLEIADDRVALAAAAALLRDSLPGYAPIWHIHQAVRSVDPVGALMGIRDELDSAVPKSVATAASWISERGGPVLAAPSSAVVARVLARLGGPDDPDFGDAAYGEAVHAVVGLAGADAVGPTAILNIKGTCAVAERVPTLVVTTSLKLVPGNVFATLGAPTFEQIPLSAFAAVVLDGELLSPREVGQRAAMVTGDVSLIR